MMMISAAVKGGGNKFLSSSTKSTLKMGAPKSVIAATTRTSTMYLRWMSMSLSAGSNLIVSSSSSTLQKARPWYTSDAEGSNMADDNAMTMKDIFENKLVVLFGVPAPFTGTCSQAHFPPFKAMARQFQNEGVDSIICYSVSDPYAMKAWSVSLGNNDDDIDFLADDGGVWAQEWGVDTRYDAVSLGLRSIRFSMLVDNGDIKAYNVVEDAAKDAEVLLEAVKAYKAKK